MKWLLKCLPLFFLFAFLKAQAINIYVSPRGSDANNGTKEKPLATLQRALHKARELRRLNDASIEGGIHIILFGGIYRLSETLVIKPEDSGTEISPTFIESNNNEQPVLSGGISIRGWKKLSTQVRGLPAIAQKKVWVADVPMINGNLFSFRQVWVNGKKAMRAKSVNGDKMERILSWNKKEQTCWIPTPKAGSLQNVNGIEMFIHQWWAIAILRVKKMEVHGDSTKLYFQQPESKIESDHPWPAPWISKETGNSPFYLTNALQFLDEPGEWYLDVIKRKIYYWPGSNEHMPTADLVAPYLETLVKIEGTMDRPVSHISFRGISFQNTGWLRPSHFGHVPIQAGMYLTEAYKLTPKGTKDKPSLDNQAWIGRPAAAIEVDYANNTRFEGCRFEHLASTGLDYRKGVHENLIIGNLFKDIGGNAILAGVFSDEGQEIHLAYNPKDARVVCDSMRINNNFITDATNEDWSCVGIGVGYTKNTMIDHNEIENVSNSGISTGWGWNAADNVMNNNKIIANRILHYGKHNYDCAGIYTLSAQPGSLIAENYIDSIYKAPYAHLPSHWFYLYTDEGSSNLTVKDNWTPSQKYLQNANGPGNEWINNGPGVDAIIKQKAGLQHSYQRLTNERTAYKLNLPLNEEHPEVIELVMKEGVSADISLLRHVLSESNIDTNAIYHWQNHYVIFDKMADVTAIRSTLQNHFPDATVKIYYDMYYRFEKSKQCVNKTVAKEWKHILLTANLVDDKKEQQEYLDYHSTQFEKWPEVAKGFCNADFQQLLGFRNGRQLILAISIPKGESLDHLNPKTTEDNPQMVQWNKIMSKYQEGIKGTKNGETWVFLKQLMN